MRTPASRPARGLWDSAAKLLRFSGPMPVPVLVLLILLAIAGGLYLGFRAGQQRSVAASAPPKSLGSRARDAATRGALGLWRWNRARKKKARDDSR